MSRTTRMRPSPAMVVAAVALSFALAGSAIAGTGALKQAITKSTVKKIAKKQANKVLNQRESSLNVNSAKTANTATNANAVDGVSAQKVNLQLLAGTGGTVWSGGGFTMTAACSAGSALSFNATTTVDANFAAEVFEVNAGTFVGVNQTQNLFNPGDNLNPFGAANLNGALADFEYQGTTGTSVSGHLQTDEFVGGGCRVSGMVLGG